MKLSLVTALCLATACSAAQLATVQQDATAIAPELTAGCTLAGDTGPAAPYIDLICAGAEAADALLSKLPQGTGAIVAVTPVAATGSDAGLSAARLPLYRLRVLLAQTTSRVKLPEADAGHD